MGLAAASTSNCGWWWVYITNSGNAWYIMGWRADTQQAMARSQPGSNRFHRYRLPSPSDSWFSFCFLHSWHWRWHNRNQGNSRTHHKRGRCSATHGMRSTRIPLWNKRPATSHASTASWRMPQRAPRWSHTLQATTGTLRRSFVLCCWCCAQQAAVHLVQVSTTFTLAVGTMPTWIPKILKRQKPVEKVTPKNRKTRMSGPAQWMFCTGRFCWCWSAHVLLGWLPRGQRVRKDRLPGSMLSTSQSYSEVNGSNGDWCLTLQMTGVLFYSCPLLLIDT